MLTTVDLGKGRVAHVRSVWDMPHGVRRKALDAGRKALAETDSKTMVDWTIIEHAAQWLITSWDIESPVPGPGSDGWDDIDVQAMNALSLWGVEEVIPAILGVIREEPVLDEDALAAAVAADPDHPFAN